MSLAPRFRFVRTIGFCSTGFDSVGLVVCWYLFKSGLGGSPLGSRYLENLSVQESSVPLHSVNSALSGSVSRNRSGISP